MFIISKQGISVEEDGMRIFDNSSTTIINNKTEKYTADLNVSGGIVKCTRAQVYYKLNWRPDSHAYLMVTSCPSGTQTHLSKTKCEERYNFNNLYDLVPVTSAKTGITYVNKHCLFCNEPNDTSERNLLFWETMLVNKVNSFSAMFDESPQTIYEKLMSVFIRGNIHFAPVFPGMAKKCEQYDVASCNDTGMWGLYNETFEFVCLFGENLPIIAEISRERKVFKNVGCLYCNIDKLFVNEQYPCGYIKFNSGFGYKAVINMNQAPQTGKSQTMSDSHLPYIENRPMLSPGAPQNIVCESGYVFLQVSNTIRGFINIIVFVFDHTSGNIADF